MSRTFPVLTYLSAFTLLFLQVSGLFAQDTTTYHQTSNKGFSKSELLLGTQIPFQFTAGFRQNFSNRISAQVQAGIITRPYSGFIVDAMEAFGMDKKLSRVIKKAFRSGTVIGIGPNYHFGRNYIGFYGQYMHLKGGGVTPADALSVYFKKDFTQFNIASLPLFEFSLQSNAVNAGALFGHEFRLRNPKLSLLGEAGLSKIVASKSSFTSNRTLIDRTSFAQTLFKEMDQGMRDAYWKYGFIPTINLYLAYHL